MFALALALSVALAQGAPQRMTGPTLGPEQEARIQKLGKELRCAVCQGLSIADSPSSMARAQLEKVRELVAAGRSNQEVHDYFIARYGEWVLLEPSTSGVNATVWLAPGVLLLLGLFVILGQVKKRGAPAPVPQPAVAATEEDEFLKRVREEADQ